jgi:hypothetical protein
MKPAVGVTVAVYESPPPGDTVLDDGVADREKSATVIVLVCVELDSPPLSVTLNVAVYVPGAEYVTLPGTATVLDDGEPPGNVHAYDAIVPPGSLALPENPTESPGLMVMFAAGASIDAVGA